MADALALNLTITENLRERLSKMNAQREHYQKLEAARDRIHQVRSQIDNAMQQQINAVADLSHVGNANVAAPPPDNDNTDMAADYINPLMFPGVDSDAELATLSALRGGQTDLQHDPTAAAGAIAGAAEHSRHLGEARSAALARAKHEKDANVVRESKARRGQRWHDRTAARAARVLTDIYAGTPPSPAMLPGNDPAIQEMDKVARQRAEILQRLQDIVTSLADLETQARMAQDVLHDVELENVPGEDIARIIPAPLMQYLHALLVEQQKERERMLKQQQEMQEEADPETEEELREKPQRPAPAIL